MARKRRGMFWWLFRMVGVGSPMVLLLGAASYYGFDIGFFRSPETDTAKKVVGVVDRVVREKGPGVVDGFESWFGWSEPDPNAKEVASNNRGSGSSTTNSGIRTNAPRDTEVKKTADRRNGGGDPFGELAPPR